jgi:hypothetical protein
MSTSDTPIQGIGISEAANQLGALLSGETGKQTPEQDAADESPAADDATEALDASHAVDETPADEAGDEGDEEAPANDEDTEEASDPMDQLVTVKIDGKEEQIPLREALDGYQRKADYSRKTMAVAEMRKQVEAEASQVMAERAQYAQLLGALQEQLSAAVQQQPDWERLYAEDPLEYVRQKDLFRENAERLQAATAEQQRVMALMQQQNVKQVQQTVQQGRAALQEKFPAWKNPERWEKDRVAIRDYAVNKLGFTEEQVSQVYMPAAVEAVYKAMKYDELMSKRPQPQQRTGPAPLRSGTPQGMPTRRTNEITQAKKRLAQTGHVRDAAKLFESIL